MRQLLGAPSEHPNNNKLTASQQLSDIHPGIALGTSSWSISTSVAVISVSQEDASKFTADSGQHYLSVSCLDSEIMKSVLRRCQL